MKAGDLVWVIDDSVPPRLFRITAGSNNGKEAYFELASLAGSNNHVTDGKENA